MRRWAAGREVWEGNGEAGAAGAAVIQRAGTRSAGHPRQASASGLWGWQEEGRQQRMCAGSVTVLGGDVARGFGLLGLIGRQAATDKPLS